MQLTRREFAAATAGGLSLFSWAASANTARVGEIRHAHLELPAGPYTREELSRLVARAAEVAGLPAPESMSAIGAQTTAAEFPEAFALTLRFSGNPSLVVRASQRHRSGPELTLRRQHATIEYRYSQHDAAFHPIG